MTRNSLAHYFRPGMRWAWALVLAVVCALSIVGIAVMPRGPASTTPEDTVSEPLDRGRQRSEQQAEARITSLENLGEQAIPAIADALKRADDKQGVYLARVLSGIGGDESTSLLVEMVGRHGSCPEAASRALGALENRPVRRPLSREELQVLTERVGQRNVVGAGRAARVLAKCMKVGSAERIRPIVDRFKRELLSPGEVSETGISYSSPRVVARQQFLLALSYIGDPAIPALVREQRAAGRVEIEKWWVLARGMAGDGSASSHLSDMVAGETDRYVRAVAVRAYSRSAKREAIPLLESLLDDPTESEYAGCTGGKAMLIQTAARDELARLRGER